jgi:hypothetical protein
MAATPSTPAGTAATVILEKGKARYSYYKTLKKFMEYYITILYCILYQAI